MRSSLRHILFTTSLFAFIGMGSFPLWAKIGTEHQMVLGNPSEAATDAGMRLNYLILRPQYAISYNDDTHQANWVSWSYSTTDSGSQIRTDAWSVESDLPADFLRIGTATFGGDWDRGHMTPSADRTASLLDNQLTFRMSNMIPQASTNNQILWSRFEAYCREMAADGDEILVVSGPSHFTGNRIANQMSIPGKVWKVAVEVPDASSTIPANLRISDKCRVIAILTPNQSEGLLDWTDYITTVEAIEDATGLNFFTAVADSSVAIYLKNLKDTGSGPNLPTVVTDFQPKFGPPGTNVTISGYNFGSTPHVSFNGSVASNVTLVNSKTISAVVPAGAPAGVGPIFVTGGCGTDTSYEDFSVYNGTLPFLKLSQSSITDLSGVQGVAGVIRSYTVSGSNLSGPATISAPTHFEVSLNKTTFSSSLTLAPVGGKLNAVPVYVRLRSTAPAGTALGTINHSASGVAITSLTVSGSVISNQPFITLSQASLSGFATLSTRPSVSKTYTLSGFNLTSNVSVSAPAGFEISKNNINFASSLVFPPSSGTFSTTIFARLAGTASVGTVTGVVTHSGGGAAGVVLPVSGVVGASGASSTAIWDFAQPTPLGMPVSLSGGQVDRVISATSSSLGYAGASGGNNSIISAVPGALNLNDGGSSYFEFTLAPDPFVALTLSGISFGTRSTPTGPQEYSLRTSQDNFATSLASGALINDSVWRLKSHTGLSVTSNSSITFRLYGYNGTGTGLNWRIDDLALTLSSSLLTLPKPVITSPLAATGKAGSPFIYQTTALNQVTAFSAIGLPPGLTLNITSGAITGVPLMDGVFPSKITASNAAGTITQTLTLTIAATKPVINSPATAVGRAGVFFSYRITAGFGPKNFGASGLPAGLTINATSGVIAGTPTAAGNSTVTLSAGNTAGNGTQILSLAIVSSPPVITSSATANATVAGAFSRQITATNSPSKFTAFNLPAGLTINATTGLITGTPLIDGVFTVNITASNAGGSGLQTLALTVHPAIPEVTSLGSAVGRVGGAFSYRITATNYPRSFGAAGLPAGLTLNATTGMITGIPTTVGNSTITLSASNGAGSSTKSLVLAVMPPMPVMTSPTTASGSVGGPFSYQITAANSPTRYGASGLPTGLVVNAATGFITGTPTVAGSFIPKIWAVNSAGSVIANLTLTISASNP